MFSAAAMVMNSLRSLQETDQQQHQKVLQMFQRPDARGAARHKNAAIGTKTNGFELISVPSPD
jgi:hypothetical protein